MKTFKVKHFIGEQPGEQVTAWWTSEDWDKHDEYVERCKADGTYGQEVESTIILKDHPIFDSIGFNDKGLVLDMENIEVHTFKPLTPIQINLKPSICEKHYGIK